MSEFPYDSTPLANGVELEVGEWQIYPALNRIARRGEFVQLQNLSMQVLMHLSRQPGVVATYDELLDALWPGRFVAEETPRLPGPRNCGQSSAVANDARKTNMARPIVGQ